MCREFSRLAWIICTAVSRCCSAHAVVHDSHAREGCKHARWKIKASFVASLQTGRPLFLSAHYAAAGRHRRGRHRWKIGCFMDGGEKRSWGWRVWTSESNASKLASRTAAAANGTLSFFISLLIMATDGNSSAPGMGDIIQLNVGGTR